MEEDKVINKNIDETEEVVDEEDTIDENEEIEEVEEDEDEITEESDEDNSEFDETRKIDFSNKNEVYQDFFDEKKKSKFVIFLVVIFILSLIGVLGYFIYINRDKIFNKLGNVVDNMDSLVDVENDDNDNSGGTIVSTSSDDVEEKILNVYQKGSDSVVVFTYKCKDIYCDIEVTKDGFILYDEDKVYHRDMTAYELEQINNTEKTPTKSELSFNGFKEVEKLFDESYSDIIYNIDEKIYILNDSDMLLTYDEYRNKDMGSIFIIDNLLLFYGRIYDYINDKMIYFEEDIFNSIFSGYKNGEFYIFDVFSNVIIVGSDLKGASFSGSHLRPWVEDREYIRNNIYIHNDKCYYINNVSKKKEISVIDSKNEKWTYNNDGITPVYIFDDKLIYLDKEGILSVKNLLDDNNIYKTDIKLKNAYLVGVEEGFQIFEMDKSVLENEDFDEYRKYENINNEEFSKIKKCINDSDSCENSCYMVGNMINLDKEGKFISKEYYLTSSQNCVE